MYDKKAKKFYCNRCKNEIETYEKCWTKWQFPPKVNTSQDKPIKALEYQNAPIICLDCESEVFREIF